jgi:hypothetical protein
MAGMINGGGAGLQNSISIEQLYQDFLANNPHADPQAAFMAGVDVGMGQVDNFSDMPYDPSAQPDAVSGVDTFTEQLPIAGSGGGVEDFTTITAPPHNPGGFQSPGYVPGGLPGTGVDPNAGIAPQRQRGPEIDMSEFGISPTGQRNVRGA